MANYQQQAADYANQQKEWSNQAHGWNGTMGPPPTPHAAMNPITMGPPPPPPAEAAAQHNPNIAEQQWTSSGYAHWNAYGAWQQPPAMTPVWPQQYGYAQPPAANPWGYYYGAGAGPPPPPPPSGDHASHPSPTNIEQKIEFDESSDPDLMEFDKQFKNWEEKYDTWKEENKDHPDKESLASYEATWKKWRDDLLKKREELRKTKIGASSNTQAANPSSANSTNSVITADTPVAASYEGPPRYTYPPYANQPPNNFGMKPPMAAPHTYMQPPVHGGPPPTMLRGPQSYLHGRPPTGGLMGKPGPSDQGIDIKAYHGDVMNSQSWSMTEDSTPLFSSAGPTSGGIPGLDIPETDEKHVETKSSTPVKEVKIEEIKIEEPDLSKMGKNFDRNIGPIGINRHMEINPNISGSWKPPEDWYEDDDDNENGEYKSHGMKRNTSEMASLEGPPNKLFCNKPDSVSFSQVNYENTQRQDPNKLRPYQEGDYGQRYPHYDPFGDRDFHGMPDNRNESRFTGPNPDSRPMRSEYDSDLNDRFGPDRGGLERGRPPTSDRFGRGGPPFSDKFDSGQVGDRFGRGGPTGADRYGMGGSSEGDRFGRGGPTGADRYGRGGSSEGDRFGRGGPGGVFRGRGGLTEGDRFGGRGGPTEGNRFSGRGGPTEGGMFGGRGGPTEGTRLGGRGGSIEGDMFGSRGGPGEGDRFGGRGGPTDSNRYGGRGGYAEGDRFSGRGGPIEGDRFGRGRLAEGDRFGRGTAGDRFDRGGISPGERYGRGGAAERGSFGRSGPPVGDRFDSRGPLLGDGFGRGVPSEGDRLGRGLMTGDRFGRGGPVEGDRFGRGGPAEGNRFGRGGSGELDRFGRGGTYRGRFSRGGPAGDRIGRGGLEDRFGRGEPGDGFGRGRPSLGESYDRGQPAEDRFGSGAPSERGRFGRGPPIGDRFGRGGLTSRFGREPFDNKGPGELHRPLSEGRPFGSSGSDSEKFHRSGAEGEMSVRTGFSKPNQLDKCGRSGIEDEKYYGTGPNEDKFERMKTGGERAGITEQEKDRLDRPAFESERFGRPKSLGDGFPQDNDRFGNRPSESAARGGSERGRFPLRDNNERNYGPSSFGRGTFPDKSRDPNDRNFERSGFPGRTGREPNEYRKPLLANPTTEVESYRGPDRSMSSHPLDRFGRTAPNANRQDNIDGDQGTREGVRNGNNNFRHIAQQGESRPQELMKLNFDNLDKKDAKRPGGEVELNKNGHKHEFHNRIPDSRMEERKPWEHDRVERDEQRYRPRGSSEFSSFTDNNARIPPAADKGFRNLNEEPRSTHSHKLENNKTAETKVADTDANSQEKSQRDVTLAQVEKRCDDGIKVSEQSGDKVSIEDIISVPGRFMRPPKLVIILRGLPGSGKTTMAKMIKNREIENGGSAPRILCLDDYFMVEVEKMTKDVETGRTVKTKSMEYEYEHGLEDSYRAALIKSFKKQVDEKFFPFIIVDCVNSHVRHFVEICDYAQKNDFEPYIAELDVDVHTCVQRNAHGRERIDLQRLSLQWERSPSHITQLDLTSYMQDADIQEVEMEDCMIEEQKEDVSDEKEKSSEDDESVETFTIIKQLMKSKWDAVESQEATLDKLDGVRTAKKKMAESKPQSIEDWLQLSKEFDDRDKLPGKKRVRWADIEERKKQENARERGFVLGQTDWQRMTDPSMGSSALVQVKYI